VGWYAPLENLGEAAYTPLF